MCTAVVYIYILCVFYLEFLELFHPQSSGKQNCEYANTWYLVLIYTCVDFAIWAA